MRQSHWKVSALSCFAFVSVSMAAPDEGPAPPPPPARPHPIRVLVITGGHGFEHDPFMNMFKGHPDIQAKEVTQPTALAYFAPEKADEYDVMVWYDLWEKISEQDKKNLVELLNKGKPLVALHHCLSDYMEWPEAGKILGGRYWIGDRPHHTTSTYTQNQTYTAHLADPEHPITRFMKDFEVVDEVYGNLEVWPDVKPLLTVDHPKSNKVVAWTHTYGKSPVAYIQIGHGPTAFANPNYRRMVAQAIRWAAGRLPDRTQEGWTELIKPGGFDGWKFMGDPKGFWWTDDKTLRSESGKGGEWMRTEKEYGDFILRVEWKVGNGGNSGVFVRCLDKDKGWPWETGSEVQISNEPRDGAHCTGSLYGSVTVDPRPDETADAWHEFWIECRGPDIKVFSDNIPIIDVDGSKVPALAKRPLRGYIGLQDSHNRQSHIEYRRVAVKELKPGEPGKVIGGASYEQWKGAATVWRLGTQAYTFRIFTFFEAIDKAKTLDLKFIEGYPGQMLSPDQKDVKWDFNSPPEAREKVKKKLHDSGIKLVNFGVVGIPNNEAEARKIFDFAKDMGIETLTAEPDPAAMDLLDQLTAEYKINVAIHNHPKSPLTRYWNPQTVLDVIKGHSKRIGACADVGHWVRSGLDPIECLKMLKGHVICLHFKDLSEKSKDAHDVVWGTGISNVQGMLEELKNQHFSGVFSAEYEYKWENNSPDLAESFKFFRMVAEKLGQKVE
jgi:sugar phosphate isomerase/epimerase/type 1 glutamine amidotransferase